MLKINLTKYISIKDHEEILKLYGKLDENILYIEDKLDIQIFLRDGYLELVGDENLEVGVRVIEELINRIRSNKAISLRDISYLIDQYLMDYDINLSDLDNPVVYTAAGKAIRPMTLGQQRYLENIEKNDISFAIGPAGTGKTYLAVAMAVKAFKEQDVARIVLTRPAVEAGESLGFLPGDLQMKVDPYLRPLYDGIFEILGPDTFYKLLEKDIIEVAPLAYMRGRTLDNSFIILDEAQNTTSEQMKMFLTRIGNGSKAIVTGDITQKDLKSDQRSGLEEVQYILKDIEGISFNYLDKSDVVRHSIVQKIIEAYEENENK